MKFNLINLHSHSHFSILDGVATITSLVKKAADLNMPSLAITDHGTMAGGLEFYLECRKAGINPIIGVEMYVDDSPGRKGEYRHVILLAKSYVGYLNLLYIVSEANINGYYYRPRTTSEIIFNHNKDIIASTACMGGILAKLPNDKMALQEALRWRDAFGDNFVIELQLNEVVTQKYTNERLKKIANRLHIPLIVALDSHYAEKRDVELQDFVLMVREHKTIDDRKKVVYNARSLHLVDGKELFSMARKFGHNITKKEFKRYTDCTADLASGCDIKIPMGKIHIPDMGMDVSEFRKMTMREFRRFDFKDKEKYKKRMKRELDVIQKLKFQDYFLIVRDLTNWCRENRIFVGPARGSVAGSLVAFILNITKIDPLKYGLLFERFLDKSRSDAPDIDLDFQANKRDLVFSYLNDRHGQNKVARIITFNTFGEVGALRDVGRIFKLPIRSINEITGEIYRAGNIKKAFNNLSGILKDFVKENKVAFNLAKRASSLIRNSGVHPCGVVIAPNPVYKYCPLQKIKGELVSAYSEGNRGRDLSAVGLIKFDILGLNTCSIISDAIDLVKETEKKDLSDSIWKLDIKDKKLIEEANKGNTIGAFQFETESATRLLMDVKPKNFGEIAALNAINRPGPLASGAIERFINYEGIGIDNKEVKKTLKGTRGVLVYQEQVMQLLHRVAGFSLAEANNIRKLAAKKEFNTKEIKKFKKEFFEHCRKTIGNNDAIKLWNVIKEFTSYSFNASHAISYTYLFFQVLYLKNYYPRQFFASLLSNTDVGITKDRKKGSEKNKLYKYINEARRFNINVYGPDINKSGMGFTIEKDGIRFGLSKIKEIKTSAEEIIEKRPFKSFDDFIEKISGKVHKGKIIKLIQAGCFDSLMERQAVKGRFNSIRKEKVLDTNKTFLEDSVDAFGFILLHPFFFEPVKDFLLKRYCSSSLQLSQYNRWERVRVCGIILEIQEKMTGKSAAVVKMEDHRGDIYIYLDKAGMQHFKSVLKPFNIVFVDGRLMGGNRVLCYGDKDKVFNITEKIQSFLEIEECKSGMLL